MAHLKIDNLRSFINTMLSKDIVSLSNQISDSYIHSSVGLQAISGSDTEISNLNAQIESELVTLDNEINQFCIFLHQYLHDYVAVMEYLSDGSQSKVFSVPTLNLLKSNLSLQNPELKPVKVVNLKLIMDYEKTIIEKDGKHNERH